MYELEPWGEVREDLRCGKICAAIANFRFGRTKKSKIYTAADFMPDFTQAVKQNRQPGWKQILNTVTQLNRTLGGRDLRKK